MSEKAIRLKEQQVEDIAGRMEKAKLVVFYDYRGLTVAEVTELRNICRESGVEYRVIKNNLLKRAANKLSIEGLSESLPGPTAVAFGYGDPVAPARILVDFIKKLKKTELKAGILSGRVVDGESIRKLASLPSREQLIAKMLGSMNAPVSGLLMALSGVQRKFLYALCAVRDRKQA